MLQNWKCITTFAITILFASPIPATQPAQAQTFKVIYTFTGHTSAAHPLAGLTIDQQGNLYGTTAWGGKYNGGTVYELQPTQSGFTYSQLHSFGNGADGSFAWGGVTLGSNGILYGTTAGGGSHGDGAVFRVRQTSCHSAPCPWAEPRRSFTALPAKATDAIPRRESSSTQRKYLRHQRERRWLEGGRRL
jgi:uncharacterized repeat protein (TIGR03803 family)